MTERSFKLAYLMGRYHLKQEIGEALWDVPFHSVEPSRREKELAHAQYQLFLKMLLGNIPVDKKPLHQLDRTVK